jgi:ubiquinone biosynthesis protein
MFVRIDDEYRERMLDMLLAAYEQRSDQLARVLLETGYASERLDEPRLRNDIQDILDRYYGIDLKHIPPGKVIHQLLAIIRNHRIRIPTEFSMLLRGLTTAEGIGLLLDPEFNFAEQIRPFVERMARKRFGPISWLRYLRRSKADFEAILAMCQRTCG